jgi:hypothetical protein
MNANEEFIKEQLGLSGELISEASRHLSLFQNGAQSEVLYEYVALELDAGYRNNGLYLKCYSDADGDENKAHARYIKARVKQVHKVFEALKRQVYQANAEMERRIKLEQERQRQSAKQVHVDRGRLKKQNDINVSESSGSSGLPKNDMSLDEKIDAMKDALNTFEEFGKK